eukprot:CAMPEP_0179231102 /NCGR_PEP_ID=MMETSP0797-20121207/11171_1 /TAXON_ID=47934 /ORGANISM="Dinophysis acuminata, Strain DAEP01" /LENGTH=764 /DNA_ID=CAMNT_0020938181 /DNA_START=98 /DNA_END=2392 /DNA_ORIENTATION=+
MTCGEVKSFYKQEACCGNPAKTVTSALSLGAALVDDASALTRLSGMLKRAMTPSEAFLKSIYAVTAIGSHSAHICEATDAAYSTVTVMDGMSGDTEYPYGDIKVLCTVGEFDKNTGFMLVGVPDGMGAYLKDSSTVRLIFQSESYGPINWWSSVQGAFDSYPYTVNSNGASFTGSHVMYVDYDRAMLADFFSHNESAEGMVKGAGNLITNAYNLKGDLVGPRAASGCTQFPHYSNTDPSGCNDGWNTIMNGNVSLLGDEAVPPPEQADWVMQSLCSAHLEEKHQWGAGIGVNDDLFITNEEWTTYVAGQNYTGLPAHVIDLATGNTYATGVFTLGGFEKIVEVNCGHPDYVCFSPSGYNGNFGITQEEGEAARKNAMGKRPDGTDYVWTQNVVPARLYIGKKGLNAKGLPANDFLSRNGLAHGQLYGFSTPAAGTVGFVDAFSRTAAAGTTVSGALYPIDWRWDGEVRSFMHDGSWAFQHLTSDGEAFWNSCGRDCAGSKTEHNSPDPYGGARFMQSSTAGHFGIYDFTGVAGLLSGLSGSSFPSKIPATYTLLQGEQDITAQIALGGKGRKANGGYQTHMSDRYSVSSEGIVSDSAKVTFEDIDGLEWLAAAGTPDGYVLLQEDGGNDFGERTFISKVLTNGTKMTFHFIAQSGGDDNTRNKGGVGVPADTNMLGVTGEQLATSAHEFSGVVDLSGMLAKNADGSFEISAGNGHAKRQADKSMSINDKIIAMGLQAHSLSGGVMKTFRGDRGGQVYAFKPNLP